MANIEQRSERIYRLMLIWAERTDADERNHADNVGSLLADLRLYCDEYGVDFDCAFIANNPAPRALFLVG